MHFHETHIRFRFTIPCQSTKVCNVADKLYETHSNYSQRPITFEFKDKHSQRVAKKPKILKTQTATPRWLRNRQIFDTGPCA